MPLVPDRSRRVRFGKKLRNCVSVDVENAWQPARDKVVNERWKVLTAIT